MPHTILIETKKNTLNYYPSPRLWASCPWEDIVANRAEDRRGSWIDIRFADIKMGGATQADGAWSNGLNLFGSATATVAAYDDDGGGATFAVTVDNEAVGFRQAGAPFQISQSHGEFWAEMAFIAGSALDTKLGFAWGLMTNTAMTAVLPITAAGAVADVNQIYWRRDEADGDQLDTGYKADGQTAVTVKADALTGATYGGGVMPSALVAGTVYRLGMNYVPKGHRRGDYRLNYFFDGIELPDGYNVTATAGNPFPNDVRLGLFYDQVAAAATPGGNTLLWMRAAQLGVN